MNILHRNHVHQLGGKGPVLLYAHGFGCSQDVWAGVTPAFQDTCRQVLFDYVGSGLSDLAAFDPHRYARLDGYAQDVIDVCDALGLQEGVIFVGHSVSCSIGMLASIARPRIFQRLILIGPNPCFVSHPPGYQSGFARQDLEQVLALMDQNFMGWADYLASVIAGTEGKEPTARTLRDSFCSTDPVAAKAFARATFFADHRADLARVPCPSLILQHRTDALAPLAVGEYLHAHMPASELQILEVAGHCAHMSHPELVIKAMHGHLNLIGS